MKCNRHRLTVGVGEEGGHTCQSVDLNSILGLGKTDQEKTGGEGEKGHGEFSTTSRNLDHRSSQEGTRDTTSGLVDVCSVGSVDRVVSSSDLSELEIKVGTEESIEQWISETEGTVNQGNERCGECQSRGRE
jgi:hypothetical protein